MTRHFLSAVPFTLALFCAAAQAQVPSTAPPPQNVLQLSATATVEAVQDLLRIQMATSRDGTDAAQVQAQLKAALDQALAEARKSAQPGQMDVRTGDFRLMPRYSREGRITGWQGTAEMVLDGRDFARIGQAAGRIQSMNVAGVSFALSREQREKVERETQLQAVESFRAKAAELARALGFSGFTLREVAVNGSEPGMPHHPRAMMMEAAGARQDAPLAVAPGKSPVSVTVSGSVQLR